MAAPSGYGGGYGGGARGAGSSGGERPRLNLTREIRRHGPGGRAACRPSVEWRRRRGGQHVGGQGEKPSGATAAAVAHGAAAASRVRRRRQQRRLRRSLALGAGSSDRPSGMGRYGSGNRYGALQTGSSAPAPRKEEFPTMAAATQKKEEPKHVKEARLAMEKVKLEKRRLAEEAHRKEQEAAAAKKKAEREAAEQAEAAAKQKALEDAEKARVAGLESAKKLEGLTGQALADAVSKLPDKPNADAFATARFAKHGSDVSWLKTDAPALKVVAPSTEEQASLLLATQRHLASLEFPKDANGKGLIQQAFKFLFLCEVCDVEAYEAWRDADDAVSEAVPGKIKALTQTTEFFAYLDTIDDSDEDDEEGDEEEDEEDEMAPAPVPI